MEENNDLNAKTENTDEKPETTVTENKSDNAEQPSNLSTENKKLSKPKKKIIFILLTALLIVAGASAFYFMKHKKAVPRPTTTSAKSTPSSLVDNSFYLLAYDANQGGPSGTKLLEINPNSKEQKNLLTTKNESSNDSSGYSSKSTTLDSVMLVNSATRKFLTINQNQNSKSTVTIVYQDDNQPNKTLYSLTSPNDNNYIDLWSTFSPLNKTGGNSFVVGEIGQDKVQLKKIDITGAVTPLINYTPPNIPGLTGYKHPLTPGVLSSDEKTLYMNAYTCLRCDGPAIADLVSFDLTSKKFTKLFSEPDNLSGHWQKINDSTLWISATSEPGLGGPNSYEETLKYKGKLYIFDLKTNTAKKVFEKDADTYQANIIGTSSDGQKVYVEIDQLVKDAKNFDDGSGKSTGHEWHNVTKEIREYNATTGEYSVVTLPIDLNTQAISFLNSKQGEFIYSASKRSPVFGTGSSAYTINLFALDKNNSTPVQLGSFDNLIQFYGFK